MLIHLLNRVQAENYDGISGKLSTSSSANFLMVSLFLTPIHLLAKESLCSCPFSLASEGLYISSGQSESGSGGELCSGVNNSSVDSRVASSTLAMERLYLACEGLSTTALLSIGTSDTLCSGVNVTLS